MLVCLRKKKKVETLSAQSYHYNINMNDMSSEASKLGVECRNVSVESGDLLYIPRGILHAPHTYSCGKQDRYSEPAESLHVSIGIDIYSTRWASLLQNLIPK